MVKNPKQTFPQRDIQMASSSGRDAQKGWQQGNLIETTRRRRLTPVTTAVIKKKKKQKTRKGSSRRGAVVNESD